MSRTDIINFLIKKNNYNTYLEIGVDYGENFNRIDCKFKESVDPANDNYSHANPTHKMTSDEYFDKIDGQNIIWDIIFIDGLHHQDQVDRDIMNSLKFLSDNGTIVVHDCNPESEEYQKVPRSSKRWNGDVWKSFVKFRSSSDYECLTIDTDEGVGIIRKNKPGGDKFEYDLTYDSLCKNRKNYLGLISINDFLKKYD